VNQRMCAEQRRSSPNRPDHQRPTAVRGAPLLRSQREVAAGMTVIETISESMTAATIASAMSRKSCPASSWIVSTGMNTAAVVSVEARMAPQTSFPPLYAAAMGGSPAWIRR
jgi:hypothetical protein